MKILISDAWYRMAAPAGGRTSIIQAKMDRILNKALMRAQWKATARAPLDRRRAIRVPLLSRVRPQLGHHLTTLDVSVAGLRCHGRPTAPVMDIEFKVPGADFPIDTRVEVMSLKDSPLFNGCGLRFVGLEEPYKNQILRYIDRRTQTRGVR